VNFRERGKSVSAGTDTITDMTRLCAGALVTALSLMLAACGGGASTTDASDQPVSESAPAVPVIEGVFDTVSGTQIDLGSLEGQDTVLWFWAPW
jgi:ABC-type glycerol-3-phosphate transport system substrate-binding protein